MGIKAYKPKKLRIDIPEDNNFFHVRGLNTRDIIELLNHYEDLVFFIFEGIQLDDSKQAINQIFEKAPGLVHMAIAICSDEPDVEVTDIEELPILTQLQAINAIVELTLPKRIEDLETEIKKIINEFSALASKLSSSANK